MSELPNPLNVAAATTSVTVDHMRQHFACGPDVARHLEVAQQDVDAGSDHLVLQHAGPEADGFLDGFAGQLADRVRALTPT